MACRQVCKNDICKISSCVSHVVQRWAVRAACLGPSTTHFTIHYKQAMYVQHIIHSEKCLDTTTPKREQCKVCSNKYRNERRRM